MLITFAEMTFEETETLRLAAETYTWLVVAVPIMLAFMLIILFLINVAIFGVSDRLTAIKELLEDVFEDKLDEKYESDRRYREQIKADKTAAREERTLVAKPMSKHRKIFMSILAGLIPVLLLILIIMLL